MFLQSPFDSLAKDYIAKPNFDFYLIHGACLKEEFRE